jgi:hypothetical protein
MALEPNRENLERVVGVTGADPVSYNGGITHVEILCDAFHAGYSDRQGEPKVTLNLPWR